MPSLATITTGGLSAAALLAQVRARARCEHEARGFLAARHAVFIREQLPDLAASTIAEAERAMGGLLVLPGTGEQPYFVGNPPRWYENPVHDNEYLWLLNRMAHWPVLLAAHALTDESRYAEKVTDELRDWVATCPRPPLTNDDAEAHRRFNAVTPWRSLEVGIRMYRTWPSILTHLLDTPFLTADLFSLYARTLHEHGEVLAEICPRFWPDADHNHYLMESLGLLTIGCGLPELTHAAAWRTQAMRELERCMAAQFTPDGGQIEGCPLYHNGSVYWFCLGVQIAQDHGLRFSEAFTARLAKGLEYCLHAFRPSGTNVPWGDSDANRDVLNAALYGSLATDDPRWLRWFARYVSPAEIRTHALRHIWQFPDPAAWQAALAHLDALPPVTLPLVSWQRDLAQAMLRTSWERDALSIFFACRSPVNNGHAHIDPMGFDFTALGMPLIVDPGRFTYREDEDRRNFKSATWHNTLTVDNQEPFAYRSSWRFGPQEAGEIVFVQQTDRVLAAEAVQHNYAPAVHRRLLAIVDGTFLLVWDIVHDLDLLATVQLFYHFDTPRAEWDADTQSAFTDAPEVNVALYHTANLHGQTRIGAVSDALDRTRTSTRLRLDDTTSGATRRIYATIIVPHRAASPRPVLRDLIATDTDTGSACTFMLTNVRYAVEWTVGAGVVALGNPPPR